MRSNRIGQLILPVWNRVFIYNLERALHFFVECLGMTECAPLTFANFDERFNRNDKIATTNSVSLSFFSSFHQKNQFQNAKGKMIHGHMALYLALVDSRTFRKHLICTWLCCFSGFRYACNTHVFSISLCHCLNIVNIFELRLWIISNYFDYLLSIYNSVNIRVNRYKQYW